MLPGAVPEAEALGTEGVAGCRRRRVPRVSCWCLRGGRGAPAAPLPSAGPTGAFSVYRPMFNPGMQVPQVELSLATALGEEGGGEGKKNATLKGSQAFSDHSDPAQVHKPTYLRG